MSKPPWQVLATAADIGVLATVADVAPGNVDLIAPSGTVDAGDAAFGRPAISILPRPKSSMRTISSLRFEQRDANRRDTRRAQYRRSLQCERGECRLLQCGR